MVGCAGREGRGKRGAWAAPAGGPGGRPLRAPLSPPRVPRAPALLGGRPGLARKSRWTRLWGEGAGDSAGAGRQGAALRGGAQGAIRGVSTAAPETGRRQRGARARGQLSLRSPEERNGPRGRRRAGTERARVWGCLPGAPGGWARWGSQAALRSCSGGPGSGTLAPARFALHPSPHSLSGTRAFRLPARPLRQPRRARLPGASLSPSHLLTVLPPSSPPKNREF